MALASNDLIIFEQDSFVVKKIAQQYKISDLTLIRHPHPENLIIETIIRMIQSDPVKIKDDHNDTFQSTEESTGGISIPVNWFYHLLDTIIPLRFSRLRSKIKYRRIETKVVISQRKIETNIEMWANVCPHLEAPGNQEHIEFLTASPIPIKEIT